jgi:hypothetical protein
MKDSEKSWAKALLVAYGHLETICGAIDKTVLEYGINSGRYGIDVQFCANKVIALTERKKFLINVKVLVDNILKKLDNLNARILVVKYADRFSSLIASKTLNISMRTYFRRINVAIEQFCDVLQKYGYTSQKLSQIFKNEGWILEIYNSFFKKHIKTENLEKLDFLSVAFRSFKQTSVAVNG